MPGLVAATLGDRTAEWLAQSGLQMTATYLLGTLLVIICISLIARAVHSSGLSA